MDLDQFELISGSSPRGRGTRHRRHAGHVGRRFIPARAGNTERRHAREPDRTVHPRAGGEHPIRSLFECVPSGSSPRGRGTRSGRCRATGGHRFIPARAGNTWMMIPMSLLMAVHPRAGGEHDDARVSLAGFRGSSPRGRGTPRFTSLHLANSRFIPARAGNTVPAASPPASFTVHPRAGGEHVAMIPCGAVAYGSSPRGRGTLMPRPRQPADGRFIPARAGNTRSRLLRASISAVHPRAGGEHLRQVGDRTRKCGSSPRGRGTPNASTGNSTEDRFIPARAGNTRHRRHSGPCPPVHPRAGGEHLSLTGGQVPSTGSSPRGRGTPRRLLEEHPVLRFIPARAGNTGALTGVRFTSSVHPRAGGEHFARQSACLAQYGSSPRGRGTPVALEVEVVLARFIPARAGNTTTRRPARAPSPVHPRAGGEHP